MTLPFSFSSNTSPTGGQLDVDFLALGLMAITDCVATGTNTITLTPNANQPAVSSYTNNQKFAFTAVANSSAAVSLLVNALAPLPLYLPSGVQAGNGSITSGSYYVIVYLQTLNSGGGGFLIISSIPSSAISPVTLGIAKGLLVTNNAVTPSTKVTITAQQAILVTTAGVPLFLGGGTAPNVTIDLTTTGANGMDTGARPTSGWVYCYLISTGSTTAGVATATSPTAGSPTMPGGYSYLLYVGAMFCDASQNLMRSKQVGRKAQYVVTAATNTLAIPNIANGVAGTYSLTAPAWATPSITSIVPLTASEIVVAVAQTYKSGAAGNFQVAPSSSYAGCQEATNGNFAPIDNRQQNIGDCFAQFALEGTTIAWTSSAAGGAVSCMGWVDYYVTA